MNTNVTNLTNDVVSTAQDVLTACRDPRTRSRLHGIATAIESDVLWCLHRVAEGNSESLGPVREHVHGLAAKCMDLATDLYGTDGGSHSEEDSLLVSNLSRLLEDRSERLFELSGRCIVSDPALSIVYGYGSPRPHTLSTGPAEAAVPYGDPGFDVSF